MNRGERNRKTIRLYQPHKKTQNVKQFKDLKLSSSDWTLMYRNSEYLMLENTHFSIINWQRAVVANPEGKKMAFQQIEARQILSYHKRIENMG